ncbi:MAG: tRNA (adenosine(37)-N6)-threonylcarbamoyltransferase complex dimerization subunit type 1 TsaB [Lachnospiraceae bacterium]
MKILGIESSSLVASVAIWQDDSVVAEYTVNFKKTHSQTLLPMIDEIIKMTEMEKQKIDAIAVSGGPGSFTGLRIGSATAKGLGLALKKPLIHVPTVDAMAYQLYQCSTLICPIMDARRNQVYTGIYSYNNGVFQVVKPQCAMDIDDLVLELNQMGESVTFLGDGVPVYRKNIEWEAEIAVYFAPSFAARQRGAAVAALGAEMYARGEYESAAEHAPDYLRLSQAERERNEKKFELAEEKAVRC